MRSFLAALMLCLLSTCGTTMPVMAQHNHAAGHNDYAGWSSGKATNCCNNDDCGNLRNDEYQDGPAGPLVKIEGQWCPVKGEHYLTRGKSPDWNTPHACVAKRMSVICDDDGGGCTEDTRPACELLLCFTGKGGF